MREFKQMVDCLNCLISKYANWTYLQNKESKLHCEQFSHITPSLRAVKLNPDETRWSFHRSQWQPVTEVALVEEETPSSVPSLSRRVKEEQVSTEERGRFGSWGPSSLFRHSLFSPSKNTSEAASLPAHGASEFHSILLSAAQSDLRRCLIYCTSR